MKSQLRTKIAFTIAIATALLGAVEAKAQVTTLSSREQLNSALGPNAVTEDFEAYQFPAGEARRVGTVLDSTTIVEEQGPGLVRPGIRFIQDDPHGEGLQWDRQTHSAAMVTDGRFVLDFTSPVTHFGFDAFWFMDLTFPATIQIFGPDDTSLLHSQNFFEPTSPQTIFLGFANEQGIGRVALFRQESEDTLGVSPIIDNVAFGFAPIPEPGTITLGLLGLSGWLLSRRKRK